MANSRRAKRTQYGLGDLDAVNAETARNRGPSQHEGSAQAGTILAAGAVLWRETPDGRVEVAVVHRPRYDDWSLPKGKLDPGETIAHAAAREVEEETGVKCVLSRYIRQVTYPLPAPDGSQVSKHVDYFAARAGSGVFVPNHEVDQLSWLSTESARHRLSYLHDREVLNAFDSFSPDTATLLLVRHAKAGKRGDFSGDDALRPLSTAGVQQQQALHTLLPLFGPQRVYSAPRLRCTQTVAPVAADLGVEIGIEPLLSEEGYAQDPPAAEKRLLNIAAQQGNAVVCSQGGAIPCLVTSLARAAGLPLEPVRSKKASIWTLSFQRDADTVDGSLRLAAADYLPEPVRQT